MPANPAHITPSNFPKGNDWLIEQAIDSARDAIIDVQHPQGYWCYLLEADCTIPAEYILMMHFMNEIDQSLQGKLAVYIRARQNAHGGWPLFYGGYNRLKLHSKSLLCFEACRGRY